MANVSTYSPGLKSIVMVQTSGDGEHFELVAGVRLKLCCVVLPLRSIAIAMDFVAGET